jgi:hypothetical protein
MRKALGALLVVGLLAGGGAAYALLSSSSATAQDENATTAQDDSAVTDDTATDDTQVDDGTADDRAATRPERRDILGEVLDDLVGDGVITQEQADQIRDSVATKREELRGERGSGGPSGFRGGLGQAFGDFLDDGVIDADELAQLPDGHPLTDPEGPAAPYLEDGQITEEELDELMAELHELGLPFERFRGGEGDDGTES